MHRARSLFVTAALASALASALPSQGPGGGRNRRPEEITNRTGAFFADVAGPAVDGDKVAELATVELVRNATAANQPSVLYLVDLGDDQEVRDGFDQVLFGGDELGIELRAFHAGRIDLGKIPALKARYAKQAPLFVVFDDKGKASELSMSGYKPQPSALGKLLEKQAGTTVKPSLSTFAKSYGDLVRDLEQILQKKRQVQQKQARAGNDAGKKLDADRELKAVAAEEQKLLDKERELLGKVRLPDRPAGAQRLGAPNWGGPGGGGPGGTGRGGTGQGNGNGGGASGRSGG